MSLGITITTPQLECGHGVDDVGSVGTLWKGEWFWLAEGQFYRLVPTASLDEIIRDRITILPQFPELTYAADIVRSQVINQLLGRLFRATFVGPAWLRSHSDFAPLLQ